MKNFSRIFASFILVLAAHLVNAQCCASAIETGVACCENPTGWSSHRPDGNAPIGVMGDHYHGKGGLMFSYRYMRMAMKGILDGTQSIDAAAIYQNYLMAPQRMDMQMHMVGAMYALTNRITLMGMTNYLVNDMNMVGADGTEHRHQSAGLGDTRLTAIVGMWTEKRHSVHLNTGVSMPTGSITEADEGMAMEGHHHGDSRMPYAMQLGSGTWDVLMGATYLGQSDRLSWGSQVMSTFPTMENSAEYRLGNRYQFTSWGALRANDFVSFSLRGAAVSQEKIIGSDAGMDVAMAPTSDAKNTGGEQLIGAVGVNFYVPNGRLTGLRFGVEYARPFHQNWVGVQMEQQATWTLGLKYGWH